MLNVNARLFRVCSSVYACVLRTTTTRFALSTAARKSRVSRGFSPAEVSVSQRMVPNELSRRRESIEVDSVKSEPMQESNNNLIRILIRNKKGLI